MVTMKLNNIKKILGNPYYETERCLIYRADSLEAMKLIEGGVIDLTVTSPPYNIGKEYEQVKPLEHYLSWCEEWIEEVYRLTKKNGAFWLNLGYLAIENKAKAIPIPYLLWDKVPFYLIQEIVWNYGAGVAGRKFFSPRNEKFLWYVKNELEYTFNLDMVRDKDVKYPNQKKNGKLKCNPLGKNPSDVWQVAKVTSGKDRSSNERTPHPAQFPEALIERIVKACSNEDDLVFDPFLGSGTSAVVSLANNRNFLGFEIDSTYCQTAKARIEAFTERPSQSSMF